MKGITKKLLTGFLVLTSLFVSACSTPADSPKDDTDTDIQWNEENESKVETKGIATNITLSIGGGESSVWAKVKNNFTLLPSTIWVYVELYSSETYQESYTTMQLEKTDSVKDLDMGKSITISVPTGGEQKYWQARMRYKFDNRDWVSKTTSTFLYNAQGEVIDEPEEEIKEPVESGPFYSLQQAYDNGWLTQEELLSIAYYHHSEAYESDYFMQLNAELMGENYQPIPKSPETLSEDLKLSIKQSLYDLVYADTPKNINSDDISIYAYYGTYGDGIVIRLAYSENGEPYPADDVTHTDNVAGVKFYYSCYASFFSKINEYTINNRIFYWKPDSKKETEISNGQFFSLDKAYEYGLLSEENLKSIAQYYSTKAELPELDEATRESIKNAYCEKVGLEQELYGEVGIPSTYYGTYNNCIVTEILTTCEVGGDPVCYSEYTLGGVTFYNYCPLTVYRKI